MDLKPQKEKITIPTARGLVLPHVADTKDGIRGWTGKIPFALSKEDMNWILLNLLGAVTTSIIATGPYYKHIHKISNATPKSLSVLYQKDLQGVAGREEKFSGGMIKNLKLVFDLNKEISALIELVGGTYLLAQTVGAPPTYSVPASGDYFYTFIKPSGTVGNGFSINGLTTWNHVELNFAPAIEDGTDLSYNYGSAERARLERGGEPGMLITGNAKRIFDEAVNETAWDQDSIITLDFLYGVLDAAGYAFNINLDKLKIMSSPEPEKKGMSLFEETINFQAFIDSADTENTIIIQDTQVTPATQ